MASSMKGQYLSSAIEEIKHISGKDLNGSISSVRVFVGVEPPPGPFKARGGEVLHDSYVHVVLGL